MRRLLLLASLSLLVGCSNLTAGEVTEAETTGIAHCEKLHAGSTCAAACQERDTDEDGFVRCSLTATPDGSTVAQDLPALECAYGKTWSWAKGCRQPNKAVTR